MRAEIDFPGNLRLGHRTRLHACRIIARGRIEIGAHSTVLDFAVLDTEDHAGRITIGASTLVGLLSVICGGGGVTIGDDSLLAPQVTIISTDHNSDDVTRPIGAQGTVRRPVDIASDVWLGAHCSVLGGSTIGSGAIIGANSVVKGKVPPYVIAAGAPARILRQRSAADSNPRVLSAEAPAMSGA